MGEEKVTGSYVVCANCGTRSREAEDNLTGAACDYCGKNKLVKVEVRVLSERAHADALSAGSTAALWWGLIGFLLSNGKLAFGLIGAAIGFSLEYWGERRGASRMR